MSRIREPKFDTVFRGYDPSQVLEYLGRVADRVQALESQVRELQSEVAEAHRARDKALRNQVPASLDPYESVSARVTDLVRTFDQEVERLRRDADLEVERILAEARAEAERIRLDAQGKSEQAGVLAERTLREARREADKVLSGLASRREALLEELRSIRDRMLNTTKDLGGIIEGAPAGDQVVVVEETKANPRT